MSIVRTALLVSLALTPGCVAALAVVPPTVGAGVGALVAADRRHAGSAEISITNHALIGAVAGFLVDAIAIIVVLDDRREIVSRQR
jgi:hypothetical protein